MTTGQDNWVLPRSRNMFTAVVVQNIQSVKMFRTNYSPSKDIPVQSIQLEKTFRYKLSSQKRYSSTNYPVSQDIPVQNIKSVWILQYKIYR